MSLYAVSEEDVTRDAQELEMQREKYVQDLQLALVGGDQEGDYSFHLSPSHAQGGAVHLSYEKVLKDFSVSNLCVLVLDVWIGGVGGGGLTDGLQNSLAAPLLPLMERLCP